jgi:hypothetical protein
VLFQTFINRLQKRPVKLILDPATKFIDGSPISGGSSGSATKVIDIATAPFNTGERNVFITTTDLTEFNEFIIYGNYAPTGGILELINVYIGDNQAKPSARKITVRVITSHTCPHQPQVLIETYFSDVVNSSIERASSMVNEELIIPSTGDVYFLPTDYDGGFSNSFLGNGGLVPTSFGLSLGNVREVPMYKIPINFSFTQNMTATPFAAVPLFISSGAVNRALRVEYINATLTKSAAVTQNAIGTNPTTSNTAFTQEMTNFVTISALTGTQTGGSRNNSNNGGDNYYADANKTFQHGTVVNPISGAIYLNIRGGTGNVTFSGTVNIFGSILQ